MLEIVFMPNSQDFFRLANRGKMIEGTDVQNKVLGANNKI
jgi:hypothetical protein